MKDTTLRNPAPGAHRSLFGHLPDGRAVEAVTLVSSRGISATILAYGATLQSVIVPGRDGVLADVTLGHATLQEYLAQPQYFGSSVGRVANRIAGGRFILDGQNYQVPCNNGLNALHGGPGGFDKALWTILEVAAEPEPRVVLAHVSPDGDEGFPGELRVTATYALRENGELAIDYAAASDRPTLVNMTNHAYWNLAGEGAPGGAMNHVLTIPAEHFLPTDETAIPTGEFALVEGTPFDFRTPTAIGARVRDASHPQIRIGTGYDHNWVVARERSAAPRLVARLVDPGSGRSLDVLSTEPGVQFYSGNFLDGSSVGKAGQCYRMGDGVALEPQMFPDTPNRPEFGSIRLAPGEAYRHAIIFRFGAEG
ncbi:aldose epimerase family protein [Erythrobacter sp. NE805]|uniref:aldose epimerase family protein n=1 Tax=Erythrobacter sp. NE805 TaxID=3389875 RepID=UPI00396B45BB